MRTSILAISAVSAAAVSWCGSTTYRMCRSFSCINFSQGSVRAEQLDREIVDIQKHVRLVTEMGDVTFARWSFLVTEHRRCALAIATLAICRIARAVQPGRVNCYAGAGKEIGSASIRSARVRGMAVPGQPLLGF